MVQYLPMTKAGVSRPSPPTKALFVKIGWMLRYRGPAPMDPIYSEMEWVKRKKNGAEDFNFAPRNGHFYGYFPPNNGGLPKLEKLEPHCKGIAVNGLLIVFVASWPPPEEKAFRTAEAAVGAMARFNTKKQVVVGWYSDATYWPEFKKGTSRTSSALYCCKAPTTSGILLPPQERCWEIPGGKSPGAFGRAKFTYYRKDRKDDRGLAWKRAVIRCILNYGKGDDSKKLSISTRSKGHTQKFREYMVEREVASIFKRNPQLAARVRNNAGGICDACGANVVKRYGANVLEAHHLAGQPPKKGREITEGDLAALCPTCHRALHRQSRPNRRPMTVKRFKQIIDL